MLKRYESFCFNSHVPLVECLEFHDQTTSWECWGTRVFKGELKGERGTSIQGRNGTDRQTDRHRDVGYLLPPPAVVCQKKYKTGSLLSLK